MAVWERLTFRQWSTRNVLCAFRNMLKIMLALGSKYSPFFWKITATIFSCIAISVLLIFLAVFQISTENVSRPGKILSVKPVLSRQQALNQLLWNSQFLRIDAKPIFNNKLFSKGLLSLADVLTNTDSLNSWTFFKAEGLNLNDYLLLYALFNSLPLTWKKLMNSKGDVDTSTDSRNTELNYTLYLKDDTLPLDSITSSKLYWKLIEIMQVYLSARHKFSTLFQDSGDLDWEVIYQIPHIVTLHNKTRVFQYKLLHRIIYTKKSFKKTVLRKYARWLVKNRVCITQWRHRTRVLLT